MIYLTELPFLLTVVEEPESTHESFYVDVEEQRIKLQDNEMWIKKLSPHVTGEIIVYGDEPGDIWKVEFLDNGYKTYVANIQWEEKEIL